MSFKVKAGDYDFKTKSLEMKSGVGKTLKAQEVTAKLSVKDVSTFTGRKAAAAGLAGSKFALKNALRTLDGAVRSAADGENNDAESLELMARYASPRIAGTTYRGFKSRGADVKARLELHYLKDRGSDELMARTAFSPFGTRRKMHTEALKSKGKTAVKQATRKAAQKAAIISHLTKSNTMKVSPKLTPVVNKLQKVGKGAGAVIKKAGSLAAGAVKAVVGVFKYIGLIFIPILLIAFMAIAFFTGGGTDDAEASALISLKATGTVTESYFDIEITDKDGKPVASVHAKNNNNSFFFSEKNPEKGTIVISGAIRDKELVINGSVKGERIALKGTVKDGRFTLRGFMGERCMAALNGEWINPFGDTKYVITSEFGTRIHPITGEIRHHDGYDMCAATGTNSPIYAVAEGEVILAGVYGGYGNCVIIEHDSGVQSLYGHMNRITVRSGDKVLAGDQVGTEGSTGQSTGSHLHLEARLEGKAVDVLEYLPTLYDDATSVDIW